MKILLELLDFINEFQVVLTKTYSHPQFANLIRKISGINVSFKSQRAQYIFTFKLEKASQTPTTRKKCRRLRETVVPEILYAFLQRPKLCKLAQFIQVINTGRDVLNLNKKYLIRPSALVEVGWVFKFLLDKQYRLESLPPVGL